MSGRKFVWRWSWRMVRKELRQYLVILTMLTIGVATAVTGILVAHNMTEPPGALYGNGQIQADTPEPDAMAQQLQAAGIDYGIVERATVVRDGRAGVINLRAADPTNSITEPLFSLLEGRWPADDGEVALTDRVFADQPAIGATVQLDGRTVEVVGMVEDPNRLSDEFVFALAPTVFDIGETTDFMVDASAETLWNTVDVEVSTSETGGPSNRTFSAILVNVIAAFGMLEVALLVGSAFAIIARRRIRQYGLLASAGATPSMVRFAAATSGAIVGLLGTGAGLILGLVVGRLMVPALEGAVDHRIDFEYPILALLPSLVLGVLVATLAARKPAAALKRSSIASLLSSARPKPEPVGRAATFGVVLAVGGALLLIGGFGNDSLTMAALGTILAPVGLLLVSPLLVKVLGYIAGRMPLSERLAGRSIARYNRRSASMVAALALALAIPAGIAVVTGSVDGRAAVEPPNLADDQLVVWAPDVSLARSAVPAGIDTHALDTAVSSLSQVAPELTFTPLQVAVRAPGDGYTEQGITWEFPIVAAEELVGGTCNFCSVDTIGFGDEDGSREYIARLAFIGTPELLDALELESDWLDAGKPALAQKSGLLAIDNSTIADGDFILGASDVVVSESWPNIGSFPQLLHRDDLAPDATITTVGWLATSDSAIDAETLTAIGKTNLPGVELELAEPPASRSSLRTVGLLIGGLIGLGITIAAVVMLTSELAGQSAVLASLGAAPRAGRRMSAAIAGLLALVGAMLAVVIGYLPLTVMISNSANNFPFVVPWAAVISLLVIFPLVAAGIGWLMSKKSAEGLNMRDFV